MKYLPLLFAFVSAAPIQAADPDYRSFFSHPDTQILIKIATASSKAVPYKNHTLPQTVQETPLFRDGFGTAHDLPNDFFVQWSFVKKTEFGDLYLFAVEKDKALLQAFPLLYNGSTIVAYEHDDIRVTVEPHPEGH